MRYFKFIPLFLFLAQAIFAQGGWEYIRSTGINGGRVFSITSNDDYYFAGTSWGGVYYSNDLNGPWQGSNNDLAGIQNIIDLEVDQSGNVYAAAVFTDDDVFFISSDNGKSWESRSNGLPPGSVNDVFVTTLDEVIIISNSSAIYRSIDQGQNWDIDTVGIPVFTVLNQVSEHPDGELFLATNSGLYMQVPTANKLFSKQFGEWNRIGTINLADDRIQILTVSLENGKMMAKTQGAVLQFSSNKGLGWSDPVVFFSNFQNIFDAVFDPNDGDEILVASKIDANNASVAKSTDGGNIFTNVHESRWGILTLHVSNYFLLVEKKILAGMTPVGVDFSSDDGKSWENVPEGIYDMPVPPNFFNIQLDDLEPKILTMGEDKKIWESITGFAYQERAYTGLPADINVSGFHYNGFNIVFVTTSNGKLYRANTVDWVFQEVTPSANDEVIDLSFGGGKWYAGGFEGFYRSTDGGNGWTHQLIGQGGTAAVFSIAAIENTDNAIAGTDEGVWGTTDGGSTFIDISNNLPDPIITSVGYNQLNNNIMVLSNFGNAFRSTNSGDDWEEVSVGLPVSLLPINLFHSSGLNKWVIPTLNKGIYLLDENDNSWKNDVLPKLETPITNFLEFNLSTFEGQNSASSNFHFLVGTLGGTFVLTDNPTSVEDITGNVLPEDYVLLQNYPNPFNPSTSIEYSIPSESFVELKVYDVLGKEVASLVNEQQKAGVYKADFIANNLSSGMYFARIRANEFTQVVKMILLK